MKEFPCQAISIYKWERCNLTLKESPIINVGVRQWTYGLARSKYVRPSKYVRQSAVSLHLVLVEEVLKDRHSR